jgi:hypothetical protein
MKLLSDERLKLLADRHGWSIARAQGYVEGEISRRRGEAPSTYARVGIDDYALGFRAGYFVRYSPGSTSAASLDTQLVLGQFRKGDA